MSIEIGKDVETGEIASIDLNRLVETRMLIQANSGGGKSYAIRKIVEEAFGEVQIILIDVEGEFSTLREKLDFVLVGKGGDIPASSKTADVLAKKLLELNASAILDLYELTMQERKHFVKLFIDSMVNAPKELWHNCLVVVDEAHVFCPQDGESEAMSAVNDLMTRGRKRGFCGILATQRLSKLHKDSAAEANNVMIGRTGLDVDVKRASEVLGFTTQEQRLSLRDLAPGEFFCFGPALYRKVTQVKIGKVSTTHPTSGNRSGSMAPPPPPEKIKAMLSKLSEIPHVAEKQAQDLVSLQAELRDMRTKLRQAETQKAPAMTFEQLKAIREAAYADGKRSMESNAKYLTTMIERMKRVFSDISERSAKEAGMEVPKPVPPAAPEPRYLRPIPSPRPLPVKLPSPQPKQNYSTRETFDEESPEPLPGGAMRMLKVVAQFSPDPVTKERVGILSGFTISGGTWSNYQGMLKNRRYVIDNGSTFTITDEGMRVVGDVEPLPTDPETMISMWQSKLNAGEAKMLRVLADKYPEWTSKEQLGEESGYTSSGGTFSNYFGTLRRGGLVQVQDGQVRASPELFLEATA